MSVEKELKNTLDNLEIDLRQTTETIKVINEFLINQYKKEEKLQREVSIAKDLLKVLNQEKPS